MRNLAQHPITKEEALYAINDAISLSREKYSHLFGNTVVASLLKVYDYVENHGPDEFI